MANENGKWPLPAGWEYASLRELAPVNYGKGLTKAQRDETGKVPVYGSSGIVGYHSESLTDGPSVVIGRKGAAGAVHYCPSASWPIDTAYYIDFPEYVDTKYAFYGLKTLGLESLDRSTAIPSLSRDDLYAQHLPLAPLPEQERIVAEIEKQFTRLDTAVAALERVQAGLARYKASVLKAAVEGRLVPQDPAAEPADVLLQRILAERRAKWEAAELEKMAAKGQTPQNDKWKAKYKEPQGPDTADLPELPVGWVWATVEQVADIASNLVDPTLTPDAIHIAPNHIESETGRLLPYATVSEDGVTSPKHRFYEGQILYSKIRPYLAKAVLASFEGVCSADMYPIDSHIYAPYLHRYMLTSAFTSLASSHQGRTVLPKINQSALSKLPVPVPPLEEQHRISQEVERILSIAEMSGESVSLTLGRADRQRQAILQKAFRGELVRPDAKK